jgi:hypothetical protein
MIFPTLDLSKEEKAARRRWKYEAPIEITFVTDAFASSNNTPSRFFSFFLLLGGEQEGE